MSCVAPKKRRVILHEGDPRDVWIVPIRGRKMYQTCCDCGLTHGYRFKVIKEGRYKGRIAFLCSMAKGKSAAERRRKQYRWVLR